MIITAHSGSFGTIYLGDANVDLSKVPDKSVQLICIDPPYNIKKDAWDDVWGAVKKGYSPKKESSTSYYDWLEAVFVLLERKLKDNGSFFFFHNDFRMMAELDRRIKEKTKFVLRQFLVWNKRFEGSAKKGFLDGFIVRDGLTNWNKMAEYVLFYTFDNSWKLKKERIARGVKQSTISGEILSKKGNMTGWYSNIETGKNHPTSDTIVPITKHLGLTLDDLVPKFHNLKKDHSVWNYDLDGDKTEGHITPKPVALIENIILHTTDPGDVVLDCFMGSGTTGVACVRTGRLFVGIEKEEKFFKLSQKRIEAASKDPTGADLNQMVHEPK